MPKHLIRRYLPEPEKLIRHPSLRFMGNRLADPSLWHLNRRSAAGAVFWGLFCSMLPMPLQMVPATALALLFRVNLPLTVALVWISNPITALPLLWLACWVGSLLLGQPMPTVTELGSWLSSLGIAGHHSPQLSRYLAPVALGALCTGFTMACTGYLLMRLFWRWHVVRAWRQRQQARKNRQA
ncbi:MAG: DUF2062 domain-containing protein [Moraxellaceae bacterium]